MLKYIYIYLLLVIGLVSCNIKEDMSDCPGTILLDYTSYSDEILDEIEPDEQVSVYIFDTNGICCDIYSYSYGELQAIDYEFRVPIQYNGLYAVVWHGNNSSDYDITMAKGKSYKDFYLRLNYDLANSHFTHVPPSLWASPIEPIEYCASKSRHRIHMTRIHTEVNVNLRQRMVDGSIKELDMADFRTMIRAQNDVYHTDYTISRQSETLIFTNEDELQEYDFLDWAHVGTLRIMPEAKCLLQIAPLDELDSPIVISGATEVDLVDYMLQSRESSAEESGVSDQRFLDLNKVWDIDFLLNPAYVAVSLTINGWTIWLDDVNLE